MLNLFHQKALAQGREKPFELVQDTITLEVLRDRPCLVVEVQLPSGQDVSTFLKSMRELQDNDPVMQLLLASGAISTQFAKVDGLEILPKEAALEVLYHRMVAEKIGCGEKSNTLARVLHIAPGMTCNRLDSAVQAVATGLEEVAL
ncbi:MAG: hypothetical protein FJZ63_00690 [Chlamydiae bacterium]|nr:hypothetical protein [Chlamydiota bacterium]